MPRFAVFVLTFLFAVALGSPARAAFDLADINGLAVAQTDCLSDPTSTSCQDYHYAGSEDDVANLCKQMPGMPGCTLHQLCKESNYQSNPFCDSFVVLKVLCTDMPRMKPCHNFTVLCSTPGTHVDECQRPIPRVPNSNTTANDIVSICTSMTMDDCSSCKWQGSHSYINCDMLTTYSGLCQSMPDMGQCDHWKTMCQDLKTWELCYLPESQQIPIMRMYFHLGQLDYILFKSFVPRSSGQYAAFFALVVVYTIWAEIFKLFRVRISKYLRQDVVEDINSDFAVKDVTESTGLRNGLVTKRFPPILVEIILAVVHVVDMTNGLFVMLVSMTFNVGLFLAILLGYFLGYLLVGRYLTEVKQGCH
eukprot:TRINITY_DN94754_c0_g1_i1.p1 TRINITY_DN94754_c0_g1~~TRINITY_DN94754_c0_g1_i1.p1  ORF type:complete len:371 (+),score=49.16 TRINITY_DN94754_c0_g1_i1:27-1115(+)